MSWTLEDCIKWTSIMTVKVDTVKLERYIKQLDVANNKALTEAGMIVESDAKQLAPVDTGRLRNSIIHQVDGSTAYVGTNVEYAEAIEKGHSKQAPQGYLQPALDKNKNRIHKIFADAIKGIKI